MMIRWSGRALRRAIAALWLNGCYHTMNAVPRESTGCRASIKERASGRIPALVFALDEGGAPLSRKQLLTIDKHEIDVLLRDVPFFASTIFDLQIRAGVGSAPVLQSGTVLPIKVHKNEMGQVLNLVMAWVDEGSVLKLDLPVVFIGEDSCPGLKKGGYLHKLRTSLKYMCPFDHIPLKIEVDISALDIGDRIIMRDIQVHSSLKLLSKNDSTPLCIIRATKPAKSSEAFGTQHDID